MATKRHIQNKRKKMIFLSVFDFESKNAHHSKQNIPLTAHVI